MGFANAEMFFSSEGNGVITIEKIGRGARGLLDYISQVEKTGSDHPFMTNMVGVNGDLSPRSLAAEFKSIRRLKPNLSRAVAHLVVSCGNGLSSDQLKVAIETTLRVNGYGNSMYAAFVHIDTAREHIHIFASRIYVSEDGKPEVVSDSNSYKRVHAGSREVERILEIAPVVVKEIDRRAGRDGKAKHRAEHRRANLQVRDLRDSTDSDLVANIQKLKGKGRKVETKEKILTVENKYELISDIALQEAAKHVSSNEWKLAVEKRLGEELGESDAEVIFHRRGSDPAAEILGWSLLTGGANGTAVKGSSMSRSASWRGIQQLLARTAEERRDRARRQRNSGELIDSSAALAQAMKTRAAKPGFVAGALGAQARIRPVGAPEPVRGKPGLELDGYRCAKNGATWEYLRAEGDERVFFQDLPGGAVSISHAALSADPGQAIRDWLRLAVARHGNILELQGALLEDDEMRAIFIQAAAELDGLVVQPLADEISAVRAGSAKAAAAAPGAVSLDFLEVESAASAGEGAPSTELIAAARGVLASQRLAGVGLDDAVSRLMSAAQRALEEGASPALRAFQADALTLSRRLLVAGGKADGDLEREIVFAHLAGAVADLEAADGDGVEAPSQGKGNFVVEALNDLGVSHESDVARLDALEALGLGVQRGTSSPRAVPPLPGQRDLDGRLQRANQVAALAKLLSPLPTEAEAARMRAAELAGVELLWSRLEPVREWASVTAERHQREAFLGRSSAQEIARASAEADARMAGSPLATEVTRLAAVDVRAKLDAAKVGFEGMGLLEKAAEAVSGRRAAEVSNLEDELRRSEHASLRARREFEESEAGKLAAAEIERRQAAFWAEREALNQPFIGTLAHSLGAILAKLARWVAAAVRRESKDGDARRQREQLVEEARLEAGGGAEGQGGGDRRERQR